MRRLLAAAWPAKGAPAPCTARAGALAWPVSLPPPAPLPPAAVEGQGVQFTYDVAKGALRFDLPPGEPPAAAKACVIQF